MFRVENIEVDLYNYSGEFSIQILAEYVNSHKMNIIAKRIDTLKNEGWNDNIEILIHDFQGNAKILNIGPMPSSLKRIENVELHGVTFLCSPQAIESCWKTSYQPFKKFEHYPTHIGLEDFNTLFSSDIVNLPSCLYAVGFKEGGSYIHHETYGLHSWSYEIEQTIDFLISLVFAKTPGVTPKDFYCIICALDGYIEACYPCTNRNTERLVENTEYHGKQNIDILHYKTEQFPVFHHQKYILGQSTRKHIPYTIPVVDRYYLCLNRYNKYRSVHQGIPFHTKLSKIVYAGNTRGSKFNFMTDRGIEISQREYFASNAIDKTNIVCPESMPRELMIEYKYILDIDGNACTWDATAWKLNSGSVIFKPESDWIQWFYDDYQPWTHYVPLKDDFSDIQEKFLWCEKNQDKCNIMVTNCKLLFQNIYNHVNVVKYMENVVDTLIETFENNNHRSS